MPALVKKKSANKSTKPKADAVDTRTIGLLAERSLHAALKKYMAQPGDRFEVKLAGYWIDVVHREDDGSDELIEVQTGNFGPLRRKLLALLPTHRVRLVHPLAIEKELIWLDADDEVERQRRSPIRRNVLHVFHAMTYFPDLLTHPNLTLEVLLTREAELRRPKPKKHRRARGYTSIDRQLIEVVEHHVFECAADLLSLLPSGLPAGFTNRDVATLAGIPLPLAQRLTYCLRKHNLIETTEKRGQSMMHRLVSPAGRG